MDIRKILDDCYSERQRLDDAISRLERLVAGQSKRRGRPPKWLEAVKADMGLKRVSRSNVVR